MNLLTEKHEKGHTVGKGVQIITQTFPHDVVKELHDGDPAIRVIVKQLGIHSGCEKFSEGKKGDFTD